MKPVSRARFDIFAVDARHSIVPNLGAEIGWFEEVDSHISATLFLDKNDKFFTVIFMPDPTGEFRPIGKSLSHSSPASAIVDLYKKTRNIAPLRRVGQKEFDEQKTGTGIFSPVAEGECLNPNFSRLLDRPDHEPARRVISEIMKRHNDADGNFIEQFRTTGFDARVWELYLFITLNEAGLLVESFPDSVDFFATGEEKFAVEAATANLPRYADGKLVPSQRPEALEDPTDYLQNYLHTRWSGPLKTKLEKQYWTRPNSRNMPLVFAIQDFHDELSLTYSFKALPEYLYGYRYTGSHDADGSVNVVSHKILEHVWGQKQVPSGFFDLEGSENISAVICNSSGTLAKFSRMGAGAGFSADEIVMVQRGDRLDPSPGALQSKRFDRVIYEGHDETWVEGMDIYHNPYALRPLDPRSLPGAAHHWLNSKYEVETFPPVWKPISSTTWILRPSEFF